MQTSIKLTKIIPSALVLLSSITGVSAAIVFEDNFDYENEAALDAAYPIFQTAGGNPVTLGGGGYMELGNAIVSHDLGTTLTGDWTLSFKVIHTSYERFTWFAMLNDAGTEGYAFSWNSLTAGEYAGNGSVLIQKQTGAASAWDDSSVLTALSSAKGSGHNALGTGENPLMALFEASWDSATSTITLSVDGVEKASITDSSYSSFSQFQIKGNASQYYDNVLITSTIPEPSELAVGLGAIALITCAIRRRRLS